MAAPVNTQGAAFDLHSIDSLRLAVRRSPQQGLKAAAQQMEGVFVQMMLKSMRDASCQGGLLDSQQSQMFTSLYDQQISQEMAAQGRLGFADLIMRQAQGATTPSDLQPPSALPIAMEIANGMLPRAAMQRNQRDVQTGQVTTREARQPDSQAFISRLLFPAKEAARQSGIPHQLIIAQAALESGWGNREILTQQGKPSHNLFGIKATPDWKGETTSVLTTEYINGVATKVKAAFRVYKNYAEALTDYANFIRRNPRYQQVIHSDSVEKAAHALQASGYATDPDYANKLKNIVKHVENNIAKGAGKYKAALDSLF
ncbi:flagellar assembly peptidoglycan hydrolase FlgJ [Pantoea sp. KPR_PJ]|uniref:flagellar assembly peptidoglycan hydrolase FlgJ n=1 Tax=Pantoea sp. KPR_PJ TaxID=2738375 RepID=UPI003527748F